MTDDQRAIVANDVRETRSAIAVAEKLERARSAKSITDGSMEANSAPIEEQPALTEKTRAAVAKETNLPERKIRLAQEIKKAAPEVHDMVRLLYSSIIPLDEMFILNSP